jgi:hypothetical protein
MMLTGKEKNILHTGPEKIDENMSSRQKKWQRLILGSALCKRKEENKSDTAKNMPSSAHERSF